MPFLPLTPCRRIAAASLLLGALLLVWAPAARAGVETWKPGDLRIVASNDWLQALDPKGCRVVWSRRLRGAADASLVPASDQAWLAVGKDRLEAFAPDTGRRLWTQAVDLAWGPEVAGSAVWTAERGSEAGRRTLTLVSRDLASGRPVWQGPMALDLVSARVWGEDLLLHLRPFPPATPASRYLRAPSAPAPGPGTDRLALLEGAGGTLRWATPVGGTLSGGPWTFGDLALTEERGSSGVLLVARARQSETPAWSLPLPGPLLAEPAGDPEGLRVVATEGAGARLYRVDLLQGRSLWDAAVPSAPALDPVVQGNRLLLAFAEPDPQAPADEPRSRTRLLALDAATGRPLSGPLLLPGAPAQALAAPQGLLLFQKEAAREVDLDPSGRVVQDLRQRQPSQRTVEGYRLYAVRDGVAREVAGHPRDALVENPGLEAPAELSGNLLLYATRRVPLQKPGESRRQDFRHPEEPLVLHALDPASGRERWAWEGQRLEPGWTLSDGALYVTAADRNPWTGAPTSHLVALDPQTGRERWQSPLLKGLAAAPEAVPGGLFLLGTTDVAYLLDPATGAVRSTRSLVPVLNWIKWNNLAGVALLTGCIAWFIFRARRSDLFIRSIAGLAALDEAVGRATEMGKPVLYVPGLADVDDIQTLASLSILGHVARRTAEYDTPILVPNSRSVVMSMAQEVVQEAYTWAGRPEAFQRDHVRYLSDEQFGFAAGVSGMMLRERPAANFYMGTFFAEALILAETGNATGAIQIAGSASASQLPFFVAACDYTLIGEELYAASAWLSRDAMQVGSLKGQDAAKAVLMASILVGALLLSLGMPWIKELWIP